MSHKNRRQRNQHQQCGAEAVDEAHEAMAKGHAKSGIAWPNSFPFDPVDFFPFLLSGRGGEKG